MLPTVLNQTKKPLSSVLKLFIKSNELKKSGDIFRSAIHTLNLWMSASRPDSGCQPLRDQEQGALNLWKEKTALMFKGVRFWCGTTCNFFRAAFKQPLKLCQLKTVPLKPYLPKYCIFREQLYTNVYIIWVKSNYRDELSLWPKWCQGV